nr:K(+)-transporting ATPase subunit F [Streptomyces sp. SID13031]
MPRGGDGREGRAVPGPVCSDVRDHLVRTAGGGETVSAENIAGLVVAAALVLYLIAALIFPERF